MAMEQQYANALKELREAKSRIEELEYAEKLQIQLRERMQTERDEYRAHLGVIAEMTGNKGDIGAAHEGVNALSEDLARHKRMFAAACETLGDIQKLLGNSIVGIEPMLVKELIEQRDALAAHIERLTTDMRELIEKSEGVAGLHLNGDMAPWGELTKGGQFEGWLMSLDEAPVFVLARRDAIKQAEAMLHVAKWLSGEIEEGCIGLDLGGEISGPTGCSDADKCRAAGERIFREAARIWKCRFVAEAEQ